MLEAISLYPCGHTLCHSCFIKSGKKKCPFDRQRVEGFIPALNIRALCEKLKVPCNNAQHGCKEVVEAGRMNHHLKECLFETVRCPNQGCDETFFRNDENYHEQNCPYRLVYCKNKGCGRQFSIRHIKKHLEDCEYRMQPCTNVDCPELIYPVDLEEHLETCIHGMHECPGAADGCDYVSKTIRERKEHSKDCPYAKIHLLQISLMDLAKKNQEIEENYKMETEQLEQAMMCMQEGLSKKRKETNRLKNEIIQVREKNKKLNHENRKLKSQLEYAQRRKSGKIIYKPNISSDHHSHHSHHNHPPHRSGNGNHPPHRSGNGTHPPHRSGNGNHPQHRSGNGNRRPYSSGDRNNRYV